MIRRLRLMPKPLAKCEPRAYPPTNGVSFRPAPFVGRWLIEKTTAGRTETISVTRDELVYLATAVRIALAEEDK